MVRTASLLLILLVVTLTGSIFGQSRKISETEMAAVFDKARQARKLVSYRLTKLTFGFPESYSKVELMRKSTTDFSPPDRSLVVEEYKAASGKLVRTETLRIGKTKYLRNDKGEWTAAQEPSMTGYVSPVIHALDTSSEEQHTYLGKVELDGITFDVYESLILLKFNRPTRTAVQETRRKCWFDQRGLLVKETTEEGIRGIRPLVGRTQSEYDYNVAASIEVPANNK